MYGEVFVSTISLVFMLLMAFLKLVATYQFKKRIRSAYSPTHACSAYEPRPHLFVDLYGSYNYLASALPFFEDSRQMPGVCSP